MDVRYSPLVLLCCAAMLGAEPARDRFGDPLPEGAVARLGSMHLRQESGIVAAAFSPDSKVLATAGHDTVYLWDAATGKELRRVPFSLTGRVWGLRFSADGMALILASDEGALRIVDAVRGVEQHKLDPPEHYRILVLDLDRKVAVTADKEGTLAVRDLAAGKCLREVKGPTKAVWLLAGAVALTPNGKRLVLPHEDGSLHLAELASGKELLAVEMPKAKLDPSRDNDYLKIAVAPDGRYLAYHNLSNPVALCDLKTGKRLRELPSTSGNDVPTFAPDGRSVAVTTFDTVSIFAVPSGVLLRKVPIPLQVGRALVFSPDGKTLAALWWHACTVTLLDVAAGRERKLTAGHLESVRSLAFFPDGQRLVSADDGGLFLVWDLVGRELTRHSGPSPNPCSVYSLGVASDGKTVQFLRSDRAVHRWDPGAGDREQVQVYSEKAGPYIHALSPGGRFVAVTANPFSVSRAGKGPMQGLRLHDLRKQGETRSLVLPKNGWVNRLLVFSPDGRWLAADCPIWGARLWDRAKDWQMHKLKGDPVRHIAFADDGRSVALGDRRIRICETAGSGERLVVPLFDSPTALAYSPDGRFLAFAYSDGSILVHGTGTGKGLARWRGRQSTVKVLAFSRDSRLLASGGDNGIILLWKLPDDEGLPATLNEEEGVALWQALADSDAARANRALAGLAAAPAQFVPLIKERFRTTAKPSSPEEVARRIADLDSDAFQVRERATRELAEAGSDAADLLRKARAHNPSAEAKRRIEALLDRLSKGGSPERLRCLRAVEVLERIGTPQAKDVLRELSRKSLPAELREEIEASLRRIEGRRQATSEKSQTP